MDDTLEKLGTPKTYREMYMWSKQVIIGWIALVLIINFYDSTFWIFIEEISYWGFMISYIVNQCYHFNLYQDLLFIIFLRFVYIIICY